INRFAINTGLFLAGIGTAFSGMLIQIKYHMGHHGAPHPNDSVLGLNYGNWADIHKIWIVILSVLMIYHLQSHWKWYQVVFRKRLIARHQQVLAFTMLFLLAALTGFTPWIMNLFGISHLYRKTIIEIHDKIAIFLTIYLILHLLKRFRWYLSSLRKLIH
ncbi:MAG: DUF4405 domain-containing protein, partial [Bacteroidales bacterium]|nr:DUF4405 domain-containing protein [Bacteroidales bacterium]